MLVDHGQESTIHDPGPSLETPAPLAGGAASHDYYVQAAQRLSLEDSGPPVGAGPHDARLFVFVRRQERGVGPVRLPSEPVSIHDLVGKKLLTIDRDTAHADDELGYLAFSARVTAGTYRLRATRSRREIAITIPPARAAHVFVADSGTVRIDDLRVALVGAAEPFQPASEVARAMESVLSALRSPELAVPPDARALLPHAVDQDLCFGIAVAHQLWRAGDRSGFAQIVERLAPYALIPDIAILGRLVRSSSSAVPASFEAPPLLRASLSLVMTSPELATADISPDSAIAHAARSGLGDSLWCTWSTRAWDERWIEPTVEGLRALGRTADAADAGTIARTMGLAVRTVERVLHRLDARRRSPRAHVPGYTLGEVLGCSEQGTVFQATRESDGRAVALKIVSLAGNRQRRERIERDLDVLRLLEHPNVLKYDRSGVLADGDTMWFDTELCRGSVLDLLSTADASLSFERTSQIMLDALAGLAYLHGKGAIHRNVKPGNLMVRADGSVAIAHLGLATSLLATGRPGATQVAPGVARFTPREQIIALSEASPASDVWSMAATFYFLLTLDMPREELADQSELEAALQNPVVPIAERAAGVPDELARCVDRALSDNAFARPAHGAAFRNTVVAALGRDRPEPAPQAPAPAPTPAPAPPPPPAPHQPVPEPAPRPVIHLVTGKHGVTSDSSLRTTGEPLPARVIPLTPTRPGEPFPLPVPPRAKDEPPPARYGWDIPRNVVETWPTDPYDDSVVAPLDHDHTIAHVRIVTGRAPHAVYVFSSKGASIGRVGGDCDLVVDDGRMSRRHARIERSAGGWHLQDLGARNRGFVNGRGYSPGDRVALPDGAVLRLGDTLMVFRASAPTNDGKADSPSFPGVSPVAVTVRRRIDALTHGSGHVLIIGETGAGKERVAQAIGKQRAPHPFVTLNSAELSRDLARSELFGHVKGAFTNATGNKPGLVDIAGDGVLFLDEIGELSLDVQAELLRFLEDGSYRPLGSTELRHSNARVVAATHVDLEQAVQTGKFRRDLLARLRASNTQLELPPLRDRREDILGWTQLFFRERNRDPGVNPWTVGALECLLLYTWSYNLRDLRSVVIEACEFTSTFPCGTEHLPAPLRVYRGTLRTPLNLTPPDEPIAPPGDPPMGDIEAALRATHGNMRMAAQRLGIDRRKLYRLCDRFGITRDAYRGEPVGEDE
ncbi:MAG TPA: sigma 54-interacting transcriptional regulator [Kofleriaceae bacterium]|nr:sigma 54-interacting transcriptional regulator [Kofleriaceae bacterium]